MDTESEQGCVPHTAYFTAELSSVPNGEWDFGNEGSSQDINTSRVYTEAGTFTVTYTSTTDPSIQETLQVTVFPDPEPSFTASNACIDQPISFNGSAPGSVEEWDWVFGDSGSDGGQFVSYSYETSGTFNVTLKATDENGCEGSISEEVIICEPPTVIISSDPASLTSCVLPFQVDFNCTAEANCDAGSQLQFQWNFGNGQTSQEQNPPPAVYTTDGTFQVSLVVTNALGCERTLFREVNISTDEVSWDILGAADGVICGGAWPVFPDEYSPLFDYGVGEGLTADTIFNYTEEGNYCATIQVPFGTCILTDSICFEVIFPNMEIISSPHFYCEMPTEIEWEFVGDPAVASMEIFAISGYVSNPTGTLSGSGTVLFEEEPYQINGPLNITIAGLVTDINGCGQQVSKTDTLWLVNAQFLADKISGCAPLTVAFTDLCSSAPSQPLTDITWNVAGDVFSYTENTDFAYTFEEPGTYEVFVSAINDQGCMDTSWVQTIEVGEPMVPLLDLPELTVCVGDTLFFEEISNNPNIDTWHAIGDNGNLSYCFDSSAQAWVFDHQAGVQTLTMEVEYNGCYSEVSQDIQVRGAIGKISTECICDSPLDFDFTADIQNGSTWTWNFGDGAEIENSTSSTAAHTYETGDYTASLTTSSTDGCPHYVDTLQIHVRELEAALEIISPPCAGEVFVINTAPSQGVSTSCSAGYTIFWGDQSFPTIGADTIHEHMYAGEDTFDFVLAVEDANGCRDSLKLEIQTLEIDLSASPSVSEGCMPFTVDFNAVDANGQPIETANWVFPDDSEIQANTTSFDFDNIPVLYDSLGNVVPFVVDLDILTDLGCTAEIEVPILPLFPTVQWLAQDSSLCEGETAFLYPEPNLEGWEYEWIVEGQTYEGANISLPNLAEGAYTGVVSMRDETGCDVSDDLDNLIEVQAYPEASFISDSDSIAVLCATAIVTFTNTSTANASCAAGGSVQWNSCVFNTSSCSDDLTIAIEEGGLCDVAMIAATSFGCADTAYSAVEVINPMGAANFEPEATICKGDSVYFTVDWTQDAVGWIWDFGNGTTQTDTDGVWATYSFHPPGGQTTASFTVTGEADGGEVCSNSFFMDINISPVIAEFAINGQTLLEDTVHCDDFVDVFYNLSNDATNQLWDFGSDDLLFEDADIGAVDLGPGDYDIFLYIENELTGCVDTAFHTLTIFPLPEGTAQGGEICLGETLSLFASGGDFYEWVPPFYLDDPASPMPDATPPQSVDYEVLISDTNGCVVEIPADVIVVQPLVATTLDSVLIVGESVQLDLPIGNPPFTYEWSPPEGLSCTDCPNPIASPLSTTSYSVLISDYLGCFQTNFTYRFEIELLSSVGLPDAFTPNGDGVNDIIFVEGWGINSLQIYQIFNRWGELVFETTDLETGWDGYYKEELQPMDTYTYLVIADTHAASIPVEVKGFFTLLR